MYRYYITPQEVSVSNANIILEFFNSVEDAETIATTIELPDTLDIGINLAKAIINQRKQLGGRFEKLQQIADVPYIGDERFTEIVVALTGMKIEGQSAHSINSGGDLHAQVHSLQQQLQTLKAQLNLQDAADNEVWQVHIQAVQKDVFIGQAVRIVVKVADRNTGRAASSRKLHLSTPWGILKYQDGFKHYQNRALSVLTDLNGEVELEFRSPTYETLNVTQQMALESALIVLKHEATTPNQLLKEFMQLVSAYRNPVNTDLRKAIDIYFQIHKPQLMESVNRRLFNNEWQFFNTVIHASLVDAHAAGNTNIASASLIVSLKDWIGPWFQNYLDMILQDERLLEDSRNIAKDGFDKGFLVSRLLENINSYVKDEIGIAGTALGFRKAEIITNQFLARDIHSLPDDIQQQLFPVLTITKESLGGSNLGTLEALSQTKVELKREIKDRGIKGLKDINGLKIAFADIKNQFGDFDTRYGEFQNDLNVFNFKILEFDQKHLQFEADFAEFNLSRSQFDTNMVEFEQDFSQFNNDYLSFQSDKVLVNSQISSFQLESSHVDANISTFNTKNAEFNQKLTEFNHNSADVKKEIGDFLRTRRP